MAVTKNDKDGVVARGADVPLVLAQQTGARDALVDPQDHDFIPGLEDKGYHVGEVRQPAEPVLFTGGAVAFETIGDAESKFKGQSVPLSYAEQVAANDKFQRDAGDLYVGRVSVTPLSDPEEIREAKRALDSKSRPAARPADPAN